MTPLHTVFFYIIAAFVLYTAYFVVTSHNLFRSAVGLIAVLIGVAGMYLLMDAQFLSAIQVVVYIGGIVVLIIFAVLLVADVTQKVFADSSRWRKILAGTASALLFVLIAGAVLAWGFNDVNAPAPQSAQVRDIGKALLSLEKGGFALPFEVISLLLIGAMVGAITIARAVEDKPETEDKR